MATGDRHAYFCENCKTLLLTVLECDDGFTLEGLKKFTGRKSADPPGHTFILYCDNCGHETEGPFLPAPLH